MEHVKLIILPATLAVGGVKLAEAIAPQHMKGVVGVLLAVLGAGIGIAISNRVAGTVGAPKALKPAAAV